MPCCSWWCLVQEREPERWGAWWCWGNVCCTGQQLFRGRWCCVVLRCHYQAMECCCRQMRLLDDNLPWHDVLRGNGLGFRVPLPLEGGSLHVWGPCPRAPGESVIGLR